MTESPTVYSVRVMRSRKNYQCCECSTQIDSGDKYVCTNGIWDKPEIFRQCLNCGELYNDACIVDAQERGDGIALGQLKEWLMEYQSRDLKGIEFLNAMAEMISVEPEKLNLLLKIE